MAPAEQRNAPSEWQPRFMPLPTRFLKEAPERILHLRMARAFECAMQIAAGQEVQNAVIVAKITERFRARFFLSVKNKPINKTMRELIEALNYEEFLVDNLRRMPAPQGDFANALALFQDMRARASEFDKAADEVERRRGLMPNTENSTPGLE